MSGWMWGLLYAAGGAAYGSWFLRGLRRNETLRGRVEELFTLWDRHLGLFIPARFFGYSLVVAQVAFWPLPVLIMAIFDVPGHGRNVDKPSGGE